MKGTRKTADGACVLALCDVARAWSVSPGTVRRWCAEGRIAHVRTPSGQLRFPADALPTDAGDRR